MNPGNDTATPRETLLRQCLLGLAALSAAGILVELAISRHWTGKVQLIPWVMAVVALAAIVAVVRRPSRPNLQTARLVAGLVLASSAYGVWIHARANHRAAPLDADFGPKWDGMNAVSQWWAATTGAVGPSPTFAPGALGLSALALGMFTIGHQALGPSDVGPVTRQAVRRVGRMGATGVSLVFVSALWAVVWAIGEIRGLLRRSGVARRIAVAMVFVAGIVFAQWVLANPDPNRSGAPGQVRSVLASPGPRSVPENTPSAAPTTPPVSAAGATPPTPAPAPAATPNTPAPEATSPAAPQTTTPKPPPKPRAASPVRPAPRRTVPAPPPTQSSSDDDGHGHGGGDDDGDNSGHGGGGNSGHGGGDDDRRDD